MDEEKDVYQKLLESIFSKDSLIEFEKNKSDWQKNQEPKVKTIVSWIVENNIKDSKIKTQLLSFQEIKNKNFNYKDEDTDDNIVENLLLYCYSNNYQNLSFTILYNNFSTLLGSNQEIAKQLSLALQYNHYKCFDLILTEKHNAINQIKKNSKKFYFLSFRDRKRSLRNSWNFNWKWRWC